jgi:copper chaperone NosL
MALMIDKFYEFLSRPLYKSARLVLALAVVPLCFAFTAPLWRISMTAPQYPGGLWMDIWAYKLEGGEEHHIREINTLNHYIGMHALDKTAAADLDWIPFALGFMVLFALRTAAVGNVKDLVDLFVITSYVSLFAFGRFIYRLYVFGHDLLPDAPVRVKPFMPVILGHKTVANFETFSYPQQGSYMLGGFVVLVAAMLLWHLVAGRRQAVKAAKAEKTSAAAA